MTCQSNFFKSIREKLLSAKQLAAYIVEDVQEHFEALAKYIQKWNIKDCNISNFDKSSFQIGVVSGDKVYISLDCEAIYTADPDNQELVTAVATINYSTTKVPAIIIFKGVYYLCSYFKNSLDRNILFVQSATRFTNNKLGLSYIRHFYRYYPPSRSSRYCILIFDRYRSYISNDFLDFCWQYCIRLYKLLVYTTYLLQLLDIAVFQALKYWFQVELYRKIFIGTDTIDKKDFFAIFRRFWDRVFNSSTIVYNSFLKTGLIPLNLQLVLSKMKEYKQLQKQEKRYTCTPTPPTSPVRQSSPILPSSPCCKNENAQGNKLYCLEDS
jgi:hypothetical protein